MPNTHQHHRGFTLIEIMIALAIIGILAAIAMPQYSDYLIKGKLSEAMTLLSELQLRQEQYYQDNRTYLNGMTPRATAQYFTSTSCTTANSGQQYTCTATPSAASGLGFRYSVTEAGTKTTAATATPVSGWTVPSTNCWALSRGGSC